MHQPYYCLVFCLGLLQACQPVAKPETVLEEPVKIDTVKRLTQSDSLYKLGELYTSKNKRDSAVYYHLEAVRLKEGVGSDTSLLRNYVALGRLFIHFHKFTLANDYFEKARPLSNLNPGITSLDKVNLYMNLSYCKRELVNYGEARDNLRIAKEIVERDFPNDFFLLGRIDLSLGNIYYDESQYESAIKNYEQAIVHFKRAELFAQAGSGLGNIAIIYSNLGQYQLALKYLNASMQYIRLVGDESSERMTSKILNKAGVLEKLGDYDSAEFYYRKGLSIRIKNNDKGMYAFGARFSLAEFYLHQGKLDSAVHYYHQSVQSLVKNFNNSAILSRPQPDHSDITKDLAWALSEKARVLSTLYGKNNDQAYLQSSIAYLRLADSVLSVYRRYLPFEDQQFMVMQSAKTAYQMGLEIPYEVGLQSALKLFDRTREENYLDDAIYFMENSRAKLLSEALKLASVFNEISVSNEVVQQQNKLYRRRAEILQAYQANASDSLAELLTVVGKEIDLTNTKLEKINPNYALLVSKQNLPDVNELKKIAGKLDATLLEYYWSDTELFVLSVSKDNVAFESLDNTSELKENLDFVLRTLGEEGGDFTNRETYIQFVKRAHFLYKSLLPSHVHAAKSSRLIISPHGKLAFLPFEMLLEALPDTSEVNYKLPYLLHRHTISYSQGLQFLSKQESRPSKGTKLLAMGFANIPPEEIGRNRVGLGGLPGTEQEINSIKEVMRNHRNNYYLGGKASETIFKSEAPGYNIIHLAVHGESDSLNGLNSKLIFRSEVDSVNDGYLYAYELYSLNLRKASLVVLSACESGIGKQQPGEGFLSIARGFSYAGCPSQIISLWKIDDRNSAKLMSNFYKHLAKNQDVDVSLNKAKINYLADVNEFNSHPSYWAAFLSIGNTDPLDANDNRVFLVIVVFAGAITLGIFIKVYLRSKAKENAR